MPYAAKSIRPRERRPDNNRPTSDRRGYDARWRKARAYYLARNPLCVECRKQSRDTPATVVDHITPHRGDAGLFWDVTNWQSLCKPHHDYKTGRGQ